MIAVSRGLKRRKEKKKSNVLATNVDNDNNNKKVNSRPIQYFTVKIVERIGLVAKIRANKDG